MRSPLDFPRAPVHRSEAPLPPGPSQRQRERFARAMGEAAEAAGGTIDGLERAHVFEPVL